MTVLYGFLNARVNELCCRNTFYCFETTLARYRETQRLIRACGHDTSELEQAIEATTQACAHLDRVRDKVVSKFQAPKRGLDVFTCRQKETQTELKPL